MTNLENKIKKLDEIVNKLLESKIKDNLEKICVSSQFFSNEQDMLNIYLVTKYIIDEEYCSDLEIELAGICLPFTPFIIDKEQFATTYGERNSQVIWQYTTQI